MGDMGSAQGWKVAGGGAPLAECPLRRAVCPFILSCDSSWCLFLALVPNVASMWCRATPVDASEAWRSAGASS